MVNWLIFGILVILYFVYLYLGHQIKRLEKELESLDGDQSCGL